VRAGWTLQQWLRWQETLHPDEIELGLDRVRCVAENLGLERPAKKIISIAGTNGKGSCAGLLEAAYACAGFRVGRYTSPHLLRYAERIRIGGGCASDEQICRAFLAIDSARREISLTYFEFGTLAALWLFARAGLDVAILEVGMGGRLDAVNIVDADLALLTRIGLDHTAWLGESRGSIAVEKAGIMRPGKPVVCGDDDCPPEILDAACTCHAPVFALGRDFNWSENPDGTLCWQFGADTKNLGWPAPGSAVQADNAASCQMVLTLLDECLAVAQQRHPWHGLAQTGRCTRLPGFDNVILDVAHNGDAAAALAEFLCSEPKQPRTAIFGIMADKDFASVIGPMVAHIDHWIAVDLPVARALESRVVAQRLRARGAKVRVASSVAAALQQTGKDGQVLVFGSFHTVAGALQSIGGEVEV